MSAPHFLSLTLAALLLQPVNAQTPAESSPSPAAQAPAAAAPAASQPPARALARTADDPGLQWGPCPQFLPQGCAIAVLHGDPAKPNADIFLRLPAGADIPLHWHTSAERMALVAGELQVTYVGQEPIVLRAGTYAYGPAKLPHAGRCGNAGPCVLFIAFEGRVDAVPGSPPQ